MATGPRVNCRGLWARALELIGRQAGMGSRINCRRLRALKATEPLFGKGGCGPPQPPIANASALIPNGIVACLVLSLKCLSGCLRMPSGAASNALTNKEYLV